MRASLIMAGLVSSLGCAPAGELFFETRSGDRETLDFGLSVPGVERSQGVSLHSRLGQHVSLSATVTNPAFELSFPEGDQFPFFGSLEVLVRYLPTAATRDEGAFTITTEEPHLSAKLAVTGLPTEVDCSVPAALDFGAVVRGQTASIELPIKNASRYETTVVLTAPLPPFALTDDVLVLAAGETRTLGVRFNPELSADHFTGVFGLKRHQELCDEQLITLAGTGVGAVLRWSPGTLDFGTVTQGTTGRIAVEFSNLQFAPVTIDDLRTISSGPFSVADASLVVPGARRDETGALVPGTASLEVSFSPPSLGARVEILTASVSGAASQSTISINLRGVGGP